MGEILVSPQSRARLERAVNTYERNMTITGYPADPYITSVRADISSGWTERIHRGIATMKHWKRRSRYLGPNGFIASDGKLYPGSDWSNQR